MPAQEESPHMAPATAGTTKKNISLYGLLKSRDFWLARLCIEKLYENNRGVFEEPIFESMLENRWLSFIVEKRQKSPKLISGELWGFHGDTLVFVGAELIGCTADLLKWAKQEYNFENIQPLPLFEAKAENEYKNHLQDSKHDYVYMEIVANEKSLGRMIIELHSDKLPRTCRNFTKLCIGDEEERTKHSPPLALTYQNSVFHRVVKNGWIQGGDIVQGKGDNGWSVYGETFEDENYSMLHTRRGIVGMANKGRHSNASQFYITLQPAPWMDCQYVAFGEVIEGVDILDKLEAQETYNERPVQECRIKTCGQLALETL